MTADGELCTGEIGELLGVFWAGPEKLVQHPLSKYCMLVPPPTSGPVLDLSVLSLHVPGETLSGVMWHRRFWSTSRSCSLSRADGALQAQGIS